MCVLSKKGHLPLRITSRLDRGRRKDDYHKSIRRIQEELEARFVIVVPINLQEDVTNFQLFARSIFEIDPALKKIESLNGVRGADVFIPYSGKVHQDWILREIDNRVNTKVVSSAPHVLTF